MAEVFLAMQEGIGGFEKLVVVKRIFSHFCEDEQFVKMFFDEARLAASIRHPNVVEIYDVNQDDDGFFIAMEYLSGETLGYIFEHLDERSERIPIEIVCRIGADIAAGLHHAHTGTDVEGRTEPIVHRDVTPSNILVAFAGTTKLLDFGVAKAKSPDAEDSQPGTLKGKLGYLAPEQINNEPVSAQTDVFQLGVVLHEMLTGKRLFRADSDKKIMDAVLEQDIPAPSSLVDGLPDALDEIVLGALARDPADRTPSADKLRRQLEGVLGKLGKSISQHDVADWMQTAFTDRYDYRREVERECIAQMRAGRPSSEMPAVTAPFADTRPVGTDPVQGTKATVLERPSLRMKAVAPHSRTRGLVLGTLAVSAIAIVVVLLWPRGSGDAEEGPEKTDVAAAAITVDAGADPSPAPDAAAPTNRLPDTFEVAIRAEPEEATFQFNGEVVATGTYSAVLPRNGDTHTLRVSADGYQSSSITFRDAPPPEVIVLEKQAGRTPTHGRDPVRPPRNPVQSGGNEGGNQGTGEPTGDGQPPKDNPPSDNVNPWDPK
jgi:serine/threonine-protein kinase